MASVPPADPHRDVLHPADEPRDHSPGPRKRRDWGRGAAAAVLILVAVAVVALIVLL